MTDPGKRSGQDQESLDVKGKSGKIRENLDQVRSRGEKLDVDRAPEGEQLSGKEGKRSGSQKLTSTRAEIEEPQEPRRVPGAFGASREESVPGPPGAVPGTEPSDHKRKAGQRKKPNR